MSETTGDRLLEVRWTPAEVASIYAAAIQDVAAEQAVLAESEAER